MRGNPHATPARTACARGATRTRGDTVGTPWGPSRPRSAQGDAPRPLSKAGNPPGGARGTSHSPPDPRATPPGRSGVTCCRTAFRSGASSASACGPSMAGGAAERSGRARRRSRAGRTLRGSGMRRRRRRRSGRSGARPPHDEIAAGVKRGAGESAALSALGSAPQIRHGPRAGAARGRAWRGERGRPGARAHAHTRRRRRGALPFSFPTRLREGSAAPPRGGSGERRQLPHASP